MSDTLTWSGDGVTLYRGDCRSILRELSIYRVPIPHLSDAVYQHGMTIEIQPEVTKPFQVDAVITDPPYGIMKGAAFVTNGGQTVSDNAEETFNALVPEDQWIPAAWRLLRPGGYFATFCDTRRIRETEDAIRLCGALTPDDMPNIWRRFYVINQAPPPTPRPTFMSGVQECVIAWKGSKREWYGGGSTPNFWYGLPATRNAVSSHPAEKPFGAMVQLIMALTPPGAVILDPFAGSGTTLRAAQATGRSAIGIELERGWYEEIIKRCSMSRRSEASQPVLF